MAVEDDDFRDVLTVYLPGATQAEQMFCVLPATRVTHTALAGKKGMKPFTLEVLQQGDGRDVSVAVRA